MKIINDRNVKVFANDYQDKRIYSIGISKKDINGNYVNGYISCRFKKGVELNNKAIILINDAWLDFYLSNKKTIPYIFINEFELVDKGEVKEEETIVEDAPIQINEEKDAYEEFGDTIELFDDDLPF